MAIDPSLSLSVGTGGATQTANVLVSNRGAVGTSLASIAANTVHWREHTASPEGDITALQFIDCGWYYTTAGAETDNPVPHNINRYVEYPAGVFTQVTWGGSTLGIIPQSSGGTTYIVSDPVTITIPRGAIWIEHTIQKTNATISVPVIDLPATPAVLGLSEGSAASFASVSGFNNSDAVNTKFMGAAAIIGTVKVAGAQSHVIIGDSVPTSAPHDDTSTGASGGSGFMARGLDSYYPWSKIGNAGLACTGLAAGTLWKTLLTRIHPTDVWDTVGGNDLFDGQTTTQLMASKQSIYTAIKAAVTPNPRIWATTLTVNTTSTNGWATALTNQTPAAWATSYLVSANQAIMAGPAQTYRSVDINRPLQAAVDSLNWAAPDQTNIFRVLTPDGIYLNSYASSRAASAVVAALDLPVIAQTTALLARMSVQPDAAHRRAYNAHMMALVNSGALTHLDAYYVEQSHDSQAATLNWVSTSYTLTLNNSPTFTVDRGFTYNGTTSFAGSGFTPTVANANFQRDSAVLLEFVLSKTTGATAADAGCLGTTGATTAIQSCGATGISARINDLAGLAQVSVTNSAGFTAALRSGASVRSCSRDIGLAVTSDSGASTGNTSSELAQGKALSTQFSSREFAYWGFGGFPTGRHLTAICDAQHITNTILNP